MFHLCFAEVSVLVFFSGSECFTDEHRNRRRWCQSDRRCDAREQQLAGAVSCAFVLLNAARRFFTFVSLNAFLVMFFFSYSESFPESKQVRRRWCQGDRRCDAREQQRADAVACAFVLLNAA